MIQFNRTLARQRLDELMADYKNMTERHEVRFSHNFWVHMTDIYTLEMFSKFEDELWNFLNYKFKLIKDINNFACIIL